MDTSYMHEYKRWQLYATEDADLQAELSAIAGKDDEIADRFAVSLEFGTAGLRGVIGAGTNRMNIYTVRQATQGLAQYLKSKKEAPSVAISYDSRNKNTAFANAAAEVLAANGVKAYLYKTLMPTPMLSFAVRHMGCDAGIMVTASHNPAKYNGYKAYGPDGCQMTSESADAVYRYIQQTDIFSQVKHLPFEEGLASGMISWMPDYVETDYYEKVREQSVRPGICAGAGLKLVYTPLNGTGNLPVRHMLKEIGIEDVTVVPEQEMPDGNFPTCPYPNPEIRQALELGLKLCKEKGADLLLATDPDADRVGIAVKDGDDYRLLTGNEVGVLLLDYICKGRTEAGTMPQNPIYVRSIVTTSLADQVARSYQVEPRVVLTGFKYIGETILHLEEKGEENRFILGFEESYGYLAGSYVRDKDAVVASMLICEMAAYYTANGSSVLAQLQKIYDTYGTYLHKVDSFEFDGLAGMDRMKKIMADLRAQAPKEIAGYTVTEVEDYDAGTATKVATKEVTNIDLPRSNVLLYQLDCGASVIVRPSGTEPKIKIYYSAKAADRDAAEALQKKLAESMKQLLNL
ncbi:MAG: phospho-sugar mutase [Pygmaiobacter massiliensis]|nr:phospho-sugar mutase [Pygmaiobacter massiliensis]